MTSGAFGLPWLLPAPSDFKARARAVLAAPSIDVTEVRKLGAFALNLTNLEMMGKLVLKHREALINAGGLLEFRLGIASSHTMNYVALALPGTALRHNLVLDVILTGLSHSTERIGSRDSELGRASFGAILIALDYHVLGFSDAQMSPAEAENTVRNAIHYVTKLADGVRASGATCILQTLVPPANPLFGNQDSRVPGSVRSMIERFNEKLVHRVAKNRDLVLDAAFLASAVGLSVWNYARDWNMAKLAATLDSTPLYADHICRLICAARGRARMCLAIRPDGILWGGRIQRDGLEGISLGCGSTVGAAHVALQRYLLNLRRRGIVLAICGEKSEVDAFGAHPEMVLKEEQVAAFFAEGSESCETLRELAATLNLSTEAIVFLDRDPAMRARVRETLPEVAVPELTGDPADYPEILSTAGYFEVVRFPLENDNRRAVATLSTFNAASRNIVARFIATPEQINVTNKRYTERELETLESCPNKFCLQISLADSGIVASVIFDCAPEEWNCDMWIESSEHSGQRVGELALATVAQAASRAGALRLKGTCDTGSDHFEKLGFRRIAAAGTGKVESTLDLTSWRPPALPFTVIRPN